MVSVDAQQRKLGTVVLARTLTVTASAWVRAREDSRTYSMKHPEGGNGGLERAMSGARLWGDRVDFCSELSWCCEMWLNSLIDEIDSIVKRVQI